MRHVLVTLPHGFVSSNLHYRQATLRELNGHDEQFLEDIKNESPFFLQAVELLKRLVSFGDVEGSNEDIFKNLIIGDRMVLLLNLRQLTFGNVLHCIITCPSCIQKISIDIDIANLLKMTNISNLRNIHTLNIEKFKIKLRPLKTADQKSILSFSNKKTSELIEILIRLCIISSKPALPQRIPESLISIISTKLEEMDPMADIILDLHCPSCQHDFQTQFDLEKFILEEFHLRKQNLENEIHKIAFYYHWNEDTILSLPMKKRHRYVELVDNTLSGMMK